MIMPPGLRKAALTAHVTISVGWLGAVAAFLPVAIEGVTGRDAQTVRSAYLAMSWIGSYGLVPLSFASLLTGLVQALGTEWGLFRHYWVVVKLVINVLSTSILLLFMHNLRAGDYGTSPAPVVHAGIALVLLLVATLLSVYKPRGLTPYGWRRRYPRPELSQAR